MLHPGNYTITDTHAHLCDPIFEHDLDSVLARAQEAGVAAVVAVGENLADAKRNIELAATHASLLPAAGLYPGQLNQDEARSMYAFIRKERDRLAAIGEVGLDFRIAEEQPEKELQRTIFDSFINLSLELDLPLNVHSRSAGRHAVAMLLERGARRVQLHAFDGKWSAALPAVEAGYFFSLPPSITRSRQKQKLVKHLPLSCLLIETDSPVLGPEPGERNEPANAVLVVDAIAALKNTSREEVLEAVCHNTRRLYGNRIL